MFFFFMMVFGAARTHLDCFYLPHHSYRVILPNKAQADGNKSPNVFLPSLGFKLETKIHNIQQSCFQSVMNNQQLSLAFAKYITTTTLYPVKSHRQGQRRAIVHVALPLPLQITLNYIIHVAPRICVHIGIFNVNHAS